MKNFLIFIVLLTLLVVIGGVAINYVREEKTPSSNSSAVVSQIPEAPVTNLYFWSKTCPHCKNVNDFMESWEGNGQIALEKLEVNENRDNANLFLSYGTQFCKIPRNQLGVPLWITPEGECLVGDEPIIEHLENLEI